MPNARADGQVFTAFWAPAELIALARARAADDDSSLSAVIRAALSAYVEVQDVGLTLSDDEALDLARQQVYDASRKASDDYAQRWAAGDLTDADRDGLMDALRDLD